MNRKIKRNTVEDQVYKILLNDIRTLKLPPGNRVNENKIAEDLHVSRSPVRDAIKRLKGDGLLMIIPNKGAFVRKLTAFELTEMYEARLMMESYAAETAPLPLTNEERACFSSLAERARAAFAATDLREYIMVDFALHKGIVSLSRNEFISNIYDNLHWQLYEVLFETEWDYTQFQRIMNEHEQIVQNLLDGNRDAVKEWLKGHIARAREIIVARRG